MHIVALLGTLVLVGVMTYAGYRDGAFQTAYSLLRNLIGFLLAMTLFEALGNLLTVFFPKTHPGPLYYSALMFAVILALVFSLGRWVKIEFTKITVSTYPLVDRIAGIACGLANGIVLTGTLLVLWSLLPFAKFVPGDLGRVDPDRLRAGPVSLDAGRAMLSFYKFTADKVSGGRTFLLDDEPRSPPDEEGRFRYEDVNRNGQWDRGWLWRYRTQGDFHLDDLEFLSPAQRTPGGSAQPTGP